MLSTNWVIVDIFQIKGPNGSHLCFVYPVAGPRVSDILQIFNGPDMVLRKVALQAARAMATLHEHGVCHGDYTPANILLRLSGLNSLSESEIIQALGEPMTTEVSKISGEPLELTVPKYLVYPLDYIEIDQRFFTEDIYVIDSGESFNISKPPESLSVPRSYSPPELIVERRAGLASDVWALGCTLFAIRTERKFIDPFDENPDDRLCSIVETLGSPPAKW